MGINFKLHCYLWPIAICVESARTSSAGGVVSQWQPHSSPNVSVKEYVGT